MKKIFFVILAVIVVILVFSLGSFGVEADAVMSGYENTRRYAQNSKMMTVAVDTYKAEVEKKVEYEKTIAEREPADFSSLGKFGEVKEDSEYINYTDTLYMSSDYTIYPESNANVLPEEDRSLGADFAPQHEFNVTVTPRNYLSEDGGDCGGVDYVNELNAYGAIQCALFADVYVNQIAYKDIVIKGSFNVSSTNVKNYADTCWEADTGGYVYLQNDASGETAKKFFTNVTPGTMVRTLAHSYVIVGADDSQLIIYDCNAHHDCGILLHRWTWAEFAYQSAWSGSILGVLAPPNTQLPDGCLSNSGYGGTIVNAKEAS